MEEKNRSLQDVQRAGGAAALYLAASLLGAMAYFLLLAPGADSGTAAVRLAALAAARTGHYLVTLAVYVVFGLVLVVLAGALHARAKAGAEGLMQVATPVAFLWAGLLVASGMIYNVGMERALALAATDPAGAAALWSSVDAVSSGLSGNGEVVGGTWMLLVSLASLRSKVLPAALNVLGLVVAAVGLASVVPALKDLAAGFGLGQVAWCTWLGVVLLGGSRRSRA